MHAITLSNVEQGSKKNVCRRWAARLTRIRAALAADFAACAPSVMANAPLCPPHGR